MFDVHPGVFGNRLLKWTALEPPSIGAQVTRSGWQSYEIVASSTIKGN